jgi:type I restriction enzyme S subunit
MVESELGMIPKGWEIVTLKSLNKFIGGFSFKGNRNDSIGKFKIITIGNVLDGLMDLSKSTSIEVLPDKLKEEQKLNIGDILLSLTGNVGRVCMVNTDLCLLNQRVEKLQPIQNEFRGFMYFLMRSTTMFNTLQSLSRGSAQQNLSPVEVSNLKIAFSRKNTLFEAFNSIRDLILNNQLENIRIISLRDLLLPRLMSGEIEV